MYQLQQLYFSSLITESHDTDQYSSSFDSLFLENITGDNSLSQINYYPDSACINLASFSRINENFPSFKNRVEFECETMILFYPKLDFLTDKLTNN